MFLNLATTLSRRRLIQAAVQLILRSWHKKAIGVRWEKPEAGCIKVNYDGTSKGKSGNASIGGIARDHKGDFLCGYAEPIGKATGFIAEFTALKRALELVLDNGWWNVWLEGDALALVEILAHGRQAKSKEVVRLVGDINVMIPRLHDCRVTHIHREGNRAADKLANMGHQLDKLHIWQHIPCEIARIVCEDAKGKIILRKR